MFEAPPGSQPAVRVAVAVDDASRVVQKPGGDALEGEGRAEDGVPAARFQGAGRDLGGATIRHAGPDRGPRRYPRAFGRPRGDFPEIRAGPRDRRKEPDRNAELVHDLLRPALVYEVPARLQGVAPVGAYGLSGQARGDEIRLVHHPGRALAIPVVQQPDQPWKGVGAADPVPERVPDVVPDLLRRLRLFGRAAVVVHDRGRERTPLPVRQQNRARGRADGEAVHGPAAEATGRLPRGFPHCLPPGLGVLLVAHLVRALARERGAARAYLRATLFNQHDPDALGTEVYPNSDWRVVAPPAHPFSQEIKTTPSPVARTLPTNALSPHPGNLESLTFIVNDEIISCQEPIL